MDLGVTINGWDAIDAVTASAYPQKRRARGVESRRRGRLGGTHNRPARVAGFSFLAHARR